MTGQTNINSSYLSTPIAYDHQQTVYLSPFILSSETGLCFVRITLYLVHVFAGQSNQSFKTRIIPPAWLAPETDAVVAFMCSSPTNLLTEITRLLA
jgi:hypothetical protein